MNLEELVEKVRIGKVTCNLLKSVEKTVFSTYSLPLYALL